MNTNKLPYINFYPKDILTDTEYTMLSWEAKGMLSELKFRYWINGGLTSDTKKLSRICGCDQEVIERILPELNYFFREKDGRLICHELDTQYQALKTYKKRQSERGKKGAEARWRESRENEINPKKRPRKSNSDKGKDGGRISKQCPPSISSSSSSSITKEKDKDSLVKSFQDFTTLTEDHQRFAEDFLKYTKTEHNTHYAGLIKRYKNEAECDARQINSYLKTLDLLLRKDKYSFDEIVTATRFGMEDEFWKEQFRSLTYLRKHKGDQPAYISIFLSKAFRTPEARMYVWQAKMKALDEQDRKRLKGGKNG